MISRMWRVSLAVLATLTMATACLAADDPPAAAATAPATGPGPGGGPGQGGFGGQLGGAMYTMDRALGSEWFVDYSNGAKWRLSFDTHWRYTLRNRWRAQLATGFSWAGYSGEHGQNAVPKYPVPFPDPNFPSDTDKSHYLTLMLPISLQLQYLGHRGWWMYHVGAGPGVYRVWVENRRKVLKDPATQRLHRGLYPGASAEIGIERFLKGIPAVSLEATLAGHLALAQRPEQFPSGFNSNVMATELRFGGNYYFTPGPRKAPPAEKKFP